MAPPAGDASLLADADQVRDEKPPLQQTRMGETAEWIDAQNLKQARAAEVLGIDRLSVAVVVNQESPKLMLNALGDPVLPMCQHVQLPAQSIIAFLAGPNASPLR